MTRSMRSGFACAFSTLVVAIGVTMAGGVLAIEIGVTPSLIELTSMTTLAEGSDLSGGSAGDQFTLGYTVENRDGDDLVYLFTSIVYDPTVIRFVSGDAASIFEQTIGSGLFGTKTTGLYPIVSPEPRVTSPLDTLIGLSHVVPVPGLGENFLATNAVGPELALAITFEILDPFASTSIDMVFLPGDAAGINGVSYCGLGSASGCDVYSDEAFDFTSFTLNADGMTIIPIPEPNTALLLGLGLIALARSSRASSV